MPALARSPLRLFEALATPHGVDRYLELINPLLTVRELRGQVVDVRRTTPDTIALTVRPTRRWTGFRAGQFVKVRVVIDGVRRTRCYSPSNSEYRADGQVRADRQGTPGRPGLAWLHANARPGLVLDLAPADGTFTLPEGRPDRILLISGGSGITPVLSMLRTLCDELDQAATSARSCSCTTPTTPSTCRTGRGSSSWPPGTTTCGSRSSTRATTAAS